MQIWKDFQYTTTDGLSLSGRKYGWENRNSMPIVCLTGLNRSSSDMHEFAEAMISGGRQNRLLALDYRGRGKSDRDRNFENYNIITEAEDTIQGIVAAGLGHINIVGSSRGGLIAMLLGAMRPGIINSIILNDIGPEIEGTGLMRMKRNLEIGGDFSNWQEAIEFVKQTRKKHYPNWNEQVWKNLTQKLYKEENGKITRDYDPKLLKTLSAIDIGTRLADMWEQFNGLSNIPIMLLRGQNSDLLAKETADRMAKEHPNLELISLPDQGHPPDLATDDLPAMIDSFLKKHSH